MSSPRKPAEDLGTGSIFRVGVQEAQPSSKLPLSRQETKGVGGILSTKPPRQTTSHPSEGSPNLSTTRFHPGAFQCSLQKDSIRTGPSSMRMRRSLNPRAVKRTPP